MQPNLWNHTTINLDELNLWTQTTLKNLNLKNIKLQTTRTRPWSVTTKWTTDTETYWSKATAQPFYYEQPLLQKLQNLPGTPQLVAQNPDKQYILVKHAGDDLNLKNLKQPYNIWHKTIQNYTKIQQNLQTHNLNVRKINSHTIKKILTHPNMLQTLQTHLGDQELENYLKMQTLIQENFEKTQQLNFPETINHDDLHSGNITTNATVIDWADATICPIPTAAKWSLTYPNKNLGEKNQQKLIAYYHLQTAKWTGINPVLLQQHQKTADLCAIISRIDTWTKLHDYPEPTIQENGRKRLLKHYQHLKQTLPTDKLKPYSVHGTTLNL